MYTRFISSVVFPLHERLKGHASVARRRELEATQWWPAARIAAQTDARLGSFVRRAAAQVPYYRDLFAAQRIDPRSIRSVADLAQLPFLTKAAIRANTEALKRLGAGPLTRYNTGGSSGEPLVFYFGKDRVSHDVAAKWRATRWWGVDIGDPEAVVWGSPIELGAQDYVRRVRDKLMRTELLPAFEMSERKLDGFIAHLQRQRPKMLFGYPSALTHIARHAAQRGVALSDIGIKVAFVTSERLYDEQRETISRAFGCKVANGYGGRDAGFIAHECPAGGMHLSAEDIVVELVDADGRRVPDGVPGEIVVTHLATRDFPFIRYRTGDVAVRDDRTCPCGRGLPLLREIQGRTTDFVVAADGTVMHGLALIYLIRDLPGVRSFKVVQESRQRTTALMVVDDSFDRAQSSTIEAGFKRRLGASVDVNVEFVDDIPAEKSGKFRYVVSHVAAMP
ncbi:MAG: phenylacetate--CoA ligase family protein [Proteobacteria bacterium]|nr:phenylacetate--CoA ligase family protein [Pseudomonadota bacterium]